MISFSYDIINGDLLRESGSAMIDCDKAIINGSSKRRLWNEDKECFQDIEAFYISSNGIEYGRIGMSVQDYLALCRGRCGSAGGGGECPDTMIFECQFELQFE